MKEARNITRFIITFILLFLVANSMTADEKHVEYVSSENIVVGCAGVMQDVLYDYILNTPSWVFAIYQSSSEELS